MASYKKMTNQEFEKYISGFENVKDLHYVFWNVLNPILSRGCFYCFIEEFQGPNTEFNGPRQWSLCRIPAIFNDFNKKKLLLKIIIISYGNFYREENSCGMFFRQWFWIFWPWLVHRSVTFRDSIEYSNNLKQINGEKKYLNFLCN